MYNRSFVRYPRSLIWGYAILYLWMDFVPAILNALRGRFVSAIIWSLIGLAILGILVEGRAIRAVEQLRIPTPSLLILILITLLVGFTEVSNLVSQLRLLSDTEVTPSIARFIGGRIGSGGYSLGYLVLASYALSQAIRTLASRPS